MSTVMFVVYAVVAQVATLLAYPLVPIAVYFADKDGRLPWVFQWLETHDAVGWYGPMTEPAVAATTEKYGQRVGLIRWLWRNKAYRLRYWMRADVKPYYFRSESGVQVPKRWGYSHWTGKIGPYFEYQPRFGFGAFHLYMRIGWKLKPYFTGASANLTAGMFTGVSVRSDDWDDYVEQK